MSLQCEDAFYNFEKVTYRIRCMLRQRCLQMFTSKGECYCFVVIFFFRNGEDRDYNIKLCNYWACHTSYFNPGSVLFFLLNLYKIKGLVTLGQLQNGT